MTHSENRPSAGTNILGSHTSVPQLILEIDQLNEKDLYTKINGIGVKKLSRNRARLIRILGAERTTGYLVKVKEETLPKM